MASPVVTPAPSTQKIGPRPEALPFKSGYVKIRLSYLTPAPKHFRSLMLEEFGAYPPYTEEVSILMPKMKVFAMLEAFISPFQQLQRLGILHEEAQLIDYKIVEEDRLTIAYVF